MCYHKHSLLLLYSLGNVPTWAAPVSTERIPDLWIFCSRRKPRRTRCLWNSKLLPRNFLDQSIEECIDLPRNCLEPSFRSWTTGVNWATTWIQSTEILDRTCVS